MVGIGRELAVESLVGIIRPVPNFLNVGTVGPHRLDIHEN